MSDLSITSKIPFSILGTILFLAIEPPIFYDDYQCDSFMPIFKDSQTLSSAPQIGMVVSYNSNTTLKLLHQNIKGDWELLYQDGSGAKIELKDGDWEVKGKFITVLPKNGKTST